MLLLSVIEKIVLEISDASDVFSIAQVDKSLRNMCLEERFWKSKFSKQGLPFPEGEERDLLAYIILYKRCLQIYPEVKQIKLEIHDPRCCNLVDVPLFAFPQRIREKALSLLCVAKGARDEEEEEIREMASQRMYSFRYDVSLDDYHRWYVVYVNADNQVLICEIGKDKQVCLSEKFSREEIEIFFLHVFLRNGPS